MISVERCVYVTGPRVRTKVSVFAAPDGSEFIQLSSRQYTLHKLFGSTRRCIHVAEALAELKEVQNVAIAARCGCQEPSGLPRGVARKRMATIRKAIGTLKQNDVVMCDTVLHGVEMKVIMDDYHKQTIHVPLDEAVLNAIKNIVRARKERSPQRTKKARKATRDDDDEGESDGVDGAEEEQDGTDQEDDGDDSVAASED